MSYDVFFKFDVYHKDYPTSFFLLFRTSESFNQFFPSTLRTDYFPDPNYHLERTRQNLLPDAASGPSCVLVYFEIKEQSQNETRG